MFESIRPKPTTQSPTDEHPASKLSAESFLATVDAVMETDWLANLANFSSLVMSEVPGLNWAGFYLVKDSNPSVSSGQDSAKILVLGPFQGLPACIRIPIGKGVCGTAARENRTLIVVNVDDFAGHIACDSKSKSEIVIPLFINGQVRGVLDVDAPTLARFDKKTAETLEKAVKILLLKTAWPKSF